MLLTYAVVGARERAGDWVARAELADGAREGRGFGELGLRVGRVLVVRVLVGPLAAERLA